VIGFLSSLSADDESKNVTVPFLQGLKETGYVEGQNVAIEYRYAENQSDRLPALAADLVRRRVAVVVTAGGTTAVRAKAATILATADEVIQWKRREFIAGLGSIVTWRSLRGRSRATARVSLLPHWRPG
jgi:molybdopterin biosynthesis enzyme MoaB